jgi:hypothetical protein
LEIKPKYYSTWDYSRNSWMMYGNL